MSNPVPTNCANPECRERSIKPIHHSSEKVAIDAVDGPQVFSHLITYRCTQCGNTWGVRGYSGDAAEGSAGHGAAAMQKLLVSRRGW